MAWPRSMIKWNRWRICAEEGRTVEVLPEPTSVSTMWERLSSFSVMWTKSAPRVFSTKMRAMAINRSGRTACITSNPCTALAMGAASNAQAHMNGLKQSLFHAHILAIDGYDEKSTSCTTTQCKLKHSNQNIEEGLGCLCTFWNLQDHLALHTYVHQVKYMWYLWAVLALTEMSFSVWRMNQVTLTSFWTSLQRNFMPFARKEKVTTSLCVLV